MSEPKNSPNRASGSNTGTYYKVEVRTSYNQPTVMPNTDTGMGLFVIDEKWREWPVRRGSTQWGINVPIRPYDGHAAEHGLLSHEAAEAHRWTLISLLEAQSPHASLCIETRLVAVEFHEEFRMKEIGVSPPLERPRRVWDAFTPRYPEEEAK